MKVSNPEAVEKLQSEAKAGASEAERLRIKTINETFASDPEFAAKAVDEEMSIADAKVAHYDKLSDELSQAEAKIELLEGEKEEGQVEFDSTDDPKAGDDESSADPNADAVAYWNKSPGIRDEFPSKSSFVAYFKGHRDEFKQ